LKEELDFINKIKLKLSESVKVNCQRLENFDGKKAGQVKINLESSDAMQLRKVIAAETIFLQKAHGISDFNAERKCIVDLGFAHTRLRQIQKPSTTLRSN
jgi:hypothetical protein